MPTRSTSQSYTARDSAVIAEAERRRRPVIVLREDGPWLEKFANRPRSLMSGMAHRGAVIALGGGRYLIAQPGRTSVHQAAAWQVVLDGEMRPYGDYYLGFLSALVEHHLTDIGSPTIHVAVQRRSGISTKPTVVGREVAITYVTDRARWFGVEPVRISRSERYDRSDLERTLVDCLDRPHLCGSPEIYVLAWARALRRDQVDVEKLCSYALKLSDAVARRTGFLLTVAGRRDEAVIHLAGVMSPAGGSDLFDSKEPKLPGAERDTEWGLSLNVRRELIEGWFSYGK